MRFTKLLLVGLVVLGGAIWASAPSAQTRPDVSGKWQGTWAYQNASLGSGQITMTLSQKGSKATGDRLPLDARRTLGRGHGDAEGNEVLRLPNGIYRLSHGLGDEMKCQINGMNPANVVLKRQK
jgi:hypothetical protein